MWLPSDRPEYPFGLLHGSQSSSDSSEHSNDALSSAEKNWKDALAEATVPLGPWLIDAAGAVVSTVQVRVGGDASALPRPSLARTEKVCEPSESPLYAFGLVHACQPAESSLHSNDAPGSGEENSNEAEPDATVPEGAAVIEVSGGVVSTVHARDSGVASVFPTASFART